MLHHSTNTGTMSLCAGHRDPAWVVQSELDVNFRIRHKGGDSFACLLISLLYCIASCGESYRRSQASLHVKYQTGRHLVLHVCNMAFVLSGDARAFTLECAAFAAHKQYCLPRHHVPYVRYADTLPDLLLAQNSCD